MIRRYCVVRGRAGGAIIVSRFY